MSLIVAVVSTVALVAAVAWQVWALLTAWRDYGLVVRDDAPFDPVISHIERKLR